VGLANGLAVTGPNVGILLEIEADVRPARKPQQGTVVTTGVVEEEEMDGPGRTIRRKSTAKGSVENVLTVLRRYLSVDLRDYDIHVNFPGGAPVDGPSAGIAIAAAVYSAFVNKPLDNRLAMTGELSLRGLVKPVGGVAAKVEAARHAGCTRVLIPRENWQERFREYRDLEVIPVTRFDEVLELAFRIAPAPQPAADSATEPVAEPAPAVEIPVVPQPAPTVSLVEGHH